MAAADTQTRLQQQSRFLSLPAEIVIEIVSHLSDDRAALCSLAQTCQRLQPLCEEHIYTVIELLSTDDLRDILEAFSRRPERIAAVHTLKILYKFHVGLATTVAERRDFNACVVKMKALKEWHVESPYDNFHWEEGGNEWVEYDMEDFRTALEKVSYNLGQPVHTDLGLAKLNKLILHSHGATSDFWDLDRFHCLFRHPSLRYLHVSCVNLPTNLQDLAQYSSTTPLTTLIFDECEIEPGSLRHILGTPKSLKHLTLGENVYNITRDRGVTPRLSRAPDAALQALLPVAHSLESLTHYDPNFIALADPDRPPALRLKGDGMRHFHSLKFLECDPCSFIHQGIILAPTLAPPNLETLCIRHPRRQQGDLFDQLPDFTPYTYLGSLKTLEFIQSTSMKSPTYISEYVCEPESLRERHATAYKLHQHGINMKVYMEIHNSRSLIPPYLHGESTPKALCLYDAEEVGFSRTIDKDDSVDDNPEVLINLHTGVYSYASPPTERGSPREHTTIADENSSAPPKTDHLNMHDILRLKNNIRRTVFNETQVDDSSPTRRQTGLQMYLNANPSLAMYVDADDMDETEDEDNDEEDWEEMDDEAYELFLVAEDAEGGLEEVEEEGEEGEEDENELDGDVDELD